MNIHRILVSALMAASSLGCVATNHRVKKTFNPMLGTQAFPQIEKEMSGLQLMGVEGNCSLTAVTYNNLSRSQAQRTKTVYTPGNFLNEASSVSETRNYNITAGDNYWFFFQDRVLKYYTYDRYDSDGKIDQKAAGGDPKVQDRYYSMKGADKTGCHDGYYFQVKKPEESPAVEVSGNVAGSLEQKLLDAKKLLDRKVITDEEHKEMRKKILDGVK